MTAKLVMYFENTHAISRDTSCRNHWICQVPWYHFAKKSRNFGQELSGNCGAPLYQFLQNSGNFLAICSQSFFEEKWNNKPFDILTAVTFFS